jgi:hypothetical protein
VTKHGDVLLTKGRRQALALLTDKRGGMLLAEFHAAWGASRKAAAAILPRMKVSGLVVTVGNGTQTLWGVPANQGYMVRRLKQLQAEAYRERLRQSKARGKVDRAIKIKRRVVPADHVRRFAIPAVNSVWSLAA